MTTRPITLRPWQVRAALDGRLRRIVVPLRRQPELWAIKVNSHPGFIEVLGHKDGYARLIGAPYAPGDSLWGREVWTTDGVVDGLAAYRADGEPPAHLAHVRWRSPVTMPRWASRWTLTVGEVAVILVQDVAEDDMRDAGIRGNACGDWGCEGLVEDFASQFDTDHGPGSWDRNPWCVSAAVEVRRRALR